VIVLGARGKIAQRQTVAEARRLHGELDDFRPCRAHCIGTLPKIGGDSAEIVRRQHDPAPARRRQEIGEVGLPLDVDVFRAACKGVGQDRLPLFFGSLESAAFPRGTARDDDGRLPARERACSVRIADRVEAQLDQVGADDVVALASQFGRRVGRHRHTEFGHKKSLFNRKAEEA
jgi:hypothetical protein